MFTIRQAQITDAEAEILEKQQETAYEAERNKLV